MKNILSVGITLGLFLSGLQACEKTRNNWSDSALSNAEKQSLAFMREEEKMAYDVYGKMEQKWGIISFQNIKQSEWTHMEAVKTLLDRYGLADPATGKAAGEFSNIVIQQLYYSLVEKGDSSELQALIVGANIEEINIRDLKEQLLSVTHLDIKQVYENLMRGSRNHLRAFVSNLALRGYTYLPQYLSQQEFNEIINSPMEKAGMNRGGQGRNFRRY